MVRGGLQWDDPSGGPRAAEDSDLAFAPAPADVTSDETIFSIIAARARSHSSAHLGITALIGVIDAAALGWAHPGAWSVAAICAAAGAYGLWGLIDRLLAWEVATWRPDAPLTNLTRILREMIAVLGFVAILAAAAGIFGTTFNGWIS